MFKKARTAWIAALATVLPVLVVYDLFGYRARILSRNRPSGYLFSEALSRVEALPAWLIVGAGLLVAGAALWGIRRLSQILNAGEESKRRLEIVLAIGSLAVSVGLVFFYPEEVLPQEVSGLAAFAVALVLAASLVTRSGRRLWMISLAVLLAAVVSTYLPRLRAEHRSRVAAIRSALERAEIELDRRRASWVHMDPLRVETAARRRGEQTGVFRFDERLADIVEAEAPPRDSSEGVLRAFPRDGLLAAPGAGVEVRIKDGLQVIPAYPAGTRLTHREPLSIDAAQVGSLAITMTVSVGNYFEVFWSDSDVVDFHDGIRIPLGEPGRAVSYEIAESLVGFRERGTLNRIWIMPSDRNARVQIEELRIMDRTAALGEAPFQAGYENVGGEIRRVLMTSTPSTLTWKVEVPATRPRMRLGLAAADSEIPITFRVLAAAGGDARALLEETIVHGASWRDFEVDLSPWAGEETRISLRTESAEPSLGLWSNPVVFPARPAAPNVVVYLVDCLRARNLGAYGYERPTSPVFDRLVAYGTLFEQAYSNGTTTKLSIPSLFTSNPISATGVRYAPDVLPAQFPTLAEILRWSGYTTAAFATNSNVGPFSGTHQGFSNTYSGSRMAAAAGKPLDSVDIETVVAPLLEEWLARNRERGFFLYIHSLDAHAPYDPPLPYRKFFEALDGGSPVAQDPFYDPEWLGIPTAESRQALYDGEVAYGDEHLGSFLSQLWEVSQRQRTVFVFTSDHGEYFGEHGKFGHSPPAFVQGVHVPLFIMGPGIPAGRRVAEPVQLMDVLPTILDATRLEGDERLFQGSSLLPLVRGEEKTDFQERGIFIEGELPDQVSILSGPFHFIPEKNLWFDLRDDPLETRPLTALSMEFGLKTRARALAREYREIYQALYTRMTPGAAGTLDLDPETLKQLRALGYIN